MPKHRSKTTISREGTANFEIFKVSSVIPANQRRVFRVNKGEFFRQLFEKASFKVNRMTVSAGIDQELNDLLDSTPEGESVPLRLYVYHIVASNSSLYKVCDHIVLDHPWTSTISI